MSYPDRALTLKECKEFVEEHDAELLVDTQLNPPDETPQLRIRLPDSCSEPEVILSFLDAPNGYILQFSEAVTYTGRNRYLYALCTGKPIEFEDWRQLVDCINHLPDGTGSRSSSGTVTYIMPNGNVIEEKEGGPLTLEKLFEMTAVNVPEKTNTYPDEATIYKLLSQDIRGQHLAVATIAHQTAAHLAKKTPQRPLSFLLHGLPGTGKTEAGKVLGKILEKYCSPAYSFSYTQLNTFTEAHSISRLIGADPNYVGFDQKAVFEYVIDNPKMVFIFDELEKAHPEILKAFMSILDDGKLASRKELSDGSHEFDFSQCIFIFTSNLKLGNTAPTIGFRASDDIQNISISKKGVSVEYKPEDKKEQMELVRQIYQNTESARAAFMRSGVLTEIASRFGCFVEFKPLDKAAKLQIFAKMILTASYEYGIRLVKIDNGIMQELVNAAAAEDGLTVRSYRAVIEGYLASTFAATAATSGADSGTYRLGGTLASPVLVRA